MAHPLDGAFDRVDRAEEHLVDLKRRISEWSVAYRNTALADFNSRGSDEPLRGPQLHTVPSIFSILLGEICYNLRAALDYLIYELAREDSGIDQDGTQFPIEDTPEGFQARIDRGSLYGLNPDHVTAIEALQPYHGQPWLKIFRGISNRDKHRFIVAIGSEAREIVYVSANPDLIPGITVQQTRWDERTTVEMKFQFLISIRLRDGTSIPDAIEEFPLRVRDYLTQFQPEFQ